MKNTETVAGVQRESLKKKNAPSFLAKSTRLAKFENAAKNKVFKGWEADVVWESQDPLYLSFCCRLSEGPPSPQQTLSEAQRTQRTSNLFQEEKLFQ